MTRVGVTCAGTLPSAWKKIFYEKDSYRENADNLEPLLSQTDTRK